MTYRAASDRDVPETASQDRVCGPPIMPDDTLHVLKSNTLSLHSVAANIQRWLPGRQHDLPGGIKVDLSVNLCHVRGTVAKDRARTFQSVNLP